MLLLGICGGLVVLAAGAYFGRHYMRERQAQQGLRDGTAAYERGEWEAARRLLGRYLARHSNDPNVLAMLARSALAVRPFTYSELSQAATAYRQILRLKPSDAEAFDRLAAIYESHGDFAELGQIAAARLQVVPGDPRAMLASARDLLSRQKPADVIDLLESFVGAARPEPGGTALVAEAYILLAEAELALAGAAGRDAALRWLDTAVERFPDTALLRVQRSALLVQSAGREPGPAGAAFRERAIPDLNAAEAAKSNDPRVILALVEQWLSLGDFSRAEQALDRAAALEDEHVQRYVVDPSDWRAAQFLQAGRLFLLSNRLSDGVAHTRKVLAEITNDAARMVVFPTAIEVLARGGEAAEARKAFDEYRDLVHRLPNAAVHETMVTMLDALLAAAEGQSYRVINLLEPLVDRTDVPPVVHSLLGDAYARTGQYRRLREIARRGVLAGGTPRVLAIRIARGFAERSEWARVLETLDALSENDRNELDVRILRLSAQLGQAASDPAARGGVDAIVADLRGLRELDPKRVDVRLLLANAALMRDDNAGAEAELRQAMAECESPLPAFIGLARLLTSGGRQADAEALLRDATQRHPDEWVGWVALAQSLVESGRPGEGAQLLATALSQVMDDAGLRQLRLRRAVMQLLAGDEAGSRETLTAIAEADASDLEARVLLLELPGVRADASLSQRYVGELKHIEGDSGLNWRFQQARVWLAGRDWQAKFAEVRALLAYCIDADPGWSAPVLALGAACERIGDLPNAEATYKSGFRQTGDTAVGDRLMTLLQRQRRFVEARELLQRMERLLGKRAAAARQMQLALGEGNSGEALTALELQMAGGRGTPEEMLRLAMLTYLQKRDAARALELIDKAEAEGGDPIEAARGRATILVAESRPDDALAALTRLVERAGSAEAYLLRGSLHAQLGRQADADADFASLARIAPTATSIAVQGEYFAQTGRLDRAIEVWEAGLKDAPESTLLMRGVARARFTRNAAGDQSATLELVERLNQLEPLNVENLSIQALALLQGDAPGGRAKVMSILQTAIAAPPAPAQAYVQLAGVATTLGKLRLAEQLLQRGLVFEPDDVDLLMQRAETALALGQLDAAQEFARAVQRIEPSRRRALEITLEVAGARSDDATLRAGLEPLAGLLSASPSDLGLNVLRARLRIALGEGADAVRDVEALLADDANAKDFAAWLELARLQLLAKDFAKADAAIQRAASLAPGDGRVDMVRLDRVVAEGTPADMIAIAEKSLERGAGGVPVAIRAVALLMAIKGQADEALRLVQRAAELAPTNLDAQRIIGDLAYARRDADAAERAWRAALAIDPDSASTMNNLAWLLAHDRGNPAEALPLVQRAVDLEPNDPNFRDTMGTILLLLKRGAEAIDAYRRAVELWPSETAGRDRALVAFATASSSAGDLGVLRAFSAEVNELSKRDPRGVLSADERKQLAAIVASLNGQ